MTTINPASTATGANVSNALDKTEIASNFTTFLQLLTTQLKNQNPLDPLDTNQFTQQLVLVRASRAADEIQRSTREPGLTREKRSRRPRRLLMSAQPSLSTARPRN